MSSSEGIGKPLAIEQRERVLQNGLPAQFGFFRLLRFGGRTGLLHFHWLVPCGTSLTFKAAKPISEAISSPATPAFCHGAKRLLGGNVIGSLEVVPAAARLGPAPSPRGGTSGAVCGRRRGSSLVQTAGRWSAAPSSRPRPWRRPGLTAKRRHCPQAAQNGRIDAGLASR